MSSLEDLGALMLGVSFDGHKFFYCARGIKPTAGKSQLENFLKDLYKSNYDKIIKWEAIPYDEHLWRKKGGVLKNAVPETTFA